MTALRDLPKTLKIGPHVWNVVVDHEKDWGDDFGECTYLDFVISLNPAVETSSVVVGSLLHEIFHAIWYQAGLGKRPKEEKVVVTLENGLVCVLADNPSLLRFIAKHIGHEKSQD